MRIKKGVIFLFLSRTRAQTLVTAALPTDDDDDDDGMFFRVCAVCAFAQAKECIDISM